MSTFLGVADENRELSMKERKRLNQKVGFTNDYVFKYVFGSEDKVSKTILKTFLSCLLDVDVINVTHKNIEKVSNVEQKGIRMDVLVEIIDHNQNTKVINLEMQNYGAAIENEIRSQYYLSRMISEQCKDHYQNMNKSYQIMICNKIKSLKKESHFCNTFVLKHQINNYEMAHNKMVIIYIELGKLVKLDSIPIANWSLLEKLSYILKYSQDENRYDIIKLLKEEEEVVAMMYDKKEEYFRTVSLDIAKARAAFDKEIEDHLEELAYEDGFEDGEESGIQKERYQIISAMFKNGVNINDISATTNLSIEEVTKVLGE
ncbi:MAG: Rpn family recombination-promoting nuclease/putative transposase [Erysipelotrichaceae bacterium]|nr:Rpn family recombination-promoting nuclease/putative transposase [Erysipelotrichaceae bacterium]